MVRLGTLGCWGGRSFLLAIVMLAGIVVPGVAAPPVTTGLVLWVAADQGVQKDASNNVTGWQDLSGHGHNATLAMGQPVLVSGAINGLPVVRFSGNGDCLSVSGAVLSSNLYTILAVANDTGDVNWTGFFREIISNWAGGNGSTSVFLGTASDGTHRTIRFTDEIGGAVDPLHNQLGVGLIPVPTQYFVLSGVCRDTDAVVYLNKGMQYDRGSTLPGRDLTTPWFIGVQGGGEWEFWQGDIAEILVYDRGLTPWEMAQVQSYLMQRYMGPDTTPPAAVADLRVAALTRRTVTLNWTASGDDGLIGQAIGQDLRAAPVRSPRPIGRRPHPWAFLTPRHPARQKPSP